MPHASLKLIPGVDTTKTPALNEAAISNSNLIRFLPDAGGGAYAQKLGGWTAYYNSPMPTTVRALKAWEDLNVNLYLGIGCEGGLYAIRNATYLLDISPKIATHSTVYVNDTYSAASTAITVNDTDSQANTYSFVYFDTPVAVGGSKLYGAYTIDVVNSTDQYVVNAEVQTSYNSSQTATITNASPAVVTVAVTPNTGTLTYFTTTGTLPTGLYAPQTVSFSGTSPLVATVASAPDTGTIIVFTTTATLPTGLTQGQIYYATKLTATTFTVSDTPTGTAIDGSGSGSGTMLATPRYFVQKTTATQYNVALTPTGTPINTSSAGSGTHTAVFPGQIAYVSTTANSTIVSVMFPNHELTAGGTFGVTVPVSVGGITIYGVYEVYSVTDANNFTFVATNIAATSESIFVNYGLGVYIYYYSAPPTFPATAYSAGPYSSGAYGGTGTSIASLPGNNVTATDWSLDNWGNTLISCPAGGAIYAWVPDSIIQNSFYLDNAPLVNDGIFVAMPQRQVVAWGSTFTGVQDPLLIRWSDVENYNVWVADTTNQAGSYRIPTGSRIVSGMQAMQQGLFWTDVDLYNMQYVGYPLVYGFNKIGSNCGLISRKAAGQLNNNVYWMSQKQFFTLTGQGIQPMVCPVWDVIFQNLDTDNADKIRCAPNTAFNEIFWFYPSITGGTGEVDSYVKFNVILNQWDFGSLGRTAWIDQSQLGPPIGSGVDNYLYQHEVGNSANGLPINASFTTGYFAMHDGDMLTFVDQVWPDMKWGQYSQSQNATVYMTINTVNYPGDTPISYGPYPMTQQVQYLSVRVRGRLFSFTISSTDVDTFWRLGNIRYRMAPDGKY